MLKTKKDLEEYQEKLMQSAKGSIGLGIMTGLGSYAFGRIGANHPVTQPTTKAVTTGLNLINIGNIAGVGMTITSGFSDTKTKKQKKEKSAIKDPTKLILKNRFT